MLYKACLRSSLSNSPPAVVVGRGLKAHWYMEIQASYTSKLRCFSTPVTSIISVDSYRYHAQQQPGIGRVAGLAIGGSFISGLWEKLLMPEFGGSFSEEASSKAQTAETHDTQNSHKCIILREAGPKCHNGYGC